MFTRDRSGGTVVTSSLPAEKLARVNTEELIILSDECLPIASDFPGASDSTPAICKFTKTFKVFDTMNWHDSTI